MKIMIEVDCLTFGGAERVASLWANGFYRRGHDVTIVMNLRKGVNNTYQIDNGINQYNIYSWIGMKLSWFLNVHWIMVNRLKRVIRRETPDVIICVLPPWAKWSKMATKKMNIPIINTEHNSFETPESAPMTPQMFREKFVDNQDYDIITLLTSADLALAKNALKKVYVMPNPLAFTPSEKVPKKEKIILSAGRLNAWHYKGFDILLRSWSKIHIKFPDWTLEIAGTGNTKSLEYLKSIAKECDVESQTRFTGFCKDMLPLYQRSSVFVLSSRYEGFGMVLIEAMSQGAAPVACDYKGRQSEIITCEDEGLTCPVENVDALAQSLMRMLSDDDYRVKVQKRAIERSRYYVIERSMERWENILRIIN